MFGDPITSAKSRCKEGLKCFLIRSLKLHTGVDKNAFDHITFLVETLSALKVFWKLKFEAPPTRHPQVIKGYAFEMHVNNINGIAFHLTICDRITEN